MEIGGLPFTSPNDKPSRMEALRYYRRATDTYKLDIVVRRDGRRASAARRGRVRRRGDRQVRQARGGRSRRATVVLATGAYDFPEPDRRARRGPAARLALLHGAAPVLPQAGRHRRRQELRRRGGARALPRRRARHDRAPPRRRSATRSSTGSSPTSRTGSRKARSRRGSTRTSSRSRRRTWSSRRTASATRSRPTACSC